MTDEQRNYYEILEIPTDASPDEIHKGYLRAKNAYSQDSLALYSLISQDECNELLELIEEAYTILSEPNKRRQYDKVRGLNKGMDFRKTPVPEVSSPFDNSQELTLKPDADSTAQHSMTKIVAKKRFSLEFENDTSFEKEIEQTTEFTGEFLKRIREYKNVDLGRLADMTKVSKTYLRYIEEEAWEKLPASVYVRGFVFQYAKCLKLNPELVATSFLYRLKKLRGE